MNDTIHIATLRAALADVVQAVKGVQHGRAASAPCLARALEAAQALLDDPTGAEEQRQLDIQIALGACAYTLAEELCWQIHGQARRPGRPRPTPGELVDTLAEVDDLTRASLALMPDPQ